MNWRVFQGGFIFGTFLAAYSQATGATGFQTFSDLVAAGVLMGALTEACWAMFLVNYRLRNSQS